jgi:hypothetical protein
MTDGFAQMRQFAHYIDQNFTALTEIAEGKRFNALRAGMDDLFSHVSRSIDEQQAEVRELEKQITEIEELGGLMNNARSAIEELKRLGILCDLPIPMAHPKERRQSAFAQFEQWKAPVRSSPPLRQSPQPPKIPTSASEVQYREIGIAEYRSLPSIVPLLVKFDEMNKHYLSLSESARLRFTSDELVELVPLSNSRVNALTRALISLQRLAVAEDGSVTYYCLL